MWVTFCWGAKTADFPQRNRVWEKKASLGKLRDGRDHRLHYFRLLLAASADNSRFLMEREVLMHKRTIKAFIRLAVVLAALYSGMPPAPAQPAPPAAAATAPKAPPKGCKAGQMRCINNAMRKAAAIRNADRRARWLKQQKGGN
jgi:hypothetical protein